jgi:hypothetical protein
MFRYRATKFAALVLTGATVFQFSGCWNDLLVATYNAFLTSIVTQFLPLGVTGITTA